MRNDLCLKFCAALLALAAFAGCTKEVKEIQYVEVSQVSCTFQSKQNEAVTVEVRSFTKQWEAACAALWIKTERSEDGKALMITVEDNDTGSERAATITVTAGEAVQEINVNQLWGDAAFARFRRLPEFKGGVMSPNGQYIGGYTTEIAPDDSFIFTPTIIDTETGERYECTPIAQSLHWLVDPMAITNQGLLFISDATNGGQVAVDINNNSFVPELIEGFKALPQIEATSADGKYWAGFAINAPVSEGGKYHPILWTDGVPQILPMPETNFRGEDPWAGVMARGMSDDGSVIYGTTWENSDFGMVYWKDGVVRYVGEDVHEIVPTEVENKDGTKGIYNFANGLICQAQNTKISPSGKWIASTYRVEIKTPQSGIEGQFAAFYNTETETTTVIRDYGESTGTYVTDDGIAFIGLGTFGVSQGAVYDLNTGTDLGSTQDWVKDNYGIIIPDGYVTRISTDGKVLFGNYAMISAMGTDFDKRWYLAPALEE